MITARGFSVLCPNFQIFEHIHRFYNGKGYCRNSQYRFHYTEKIKKLLRRAHKAYIAFNYIHIHIGFIPFTSV